MEDSISRKAAIDTVRNLNAIVSPISDDALLVDRAEVQTELMMLPSVQEWIPVTDRLPEEEQDVLVTVHFKGVRDNHGGWNAHIKPRFYVDIAHRIDDHWSSYSDEYKVAKNRHEVVAWMPLPEPWDDGSNYDKEFWGDEK